MMNAFNGFTYANAQLAAIPVTENRGTDNRVGREIYSKIM